MNQARKGNDQQTAPEQGATASFAQAATRLVSEQAMAMTMMTAVGMSIATQFAGAMMGAFADALEKPADKSVATKPERDATMPSAETARTPVEENAAQRAATATVVPLKPAARPAAEKARAPKVVPLKAARKAQPKVADDLKAISGIGPRLEKALSARGITSLADVAALDADALARIDAELGLEGRAIRDDWVGQARTLSGKAG
jgi:NADH-quinone oxidoreductase subunit E